MESPTANASWPDRLPWMLRPFVWFVLCVVMLPYGIVMLSWMCIDSTVRNIRSERSFAAEMRRRRRCLSLSQLSERVGLNSQMGTLIIERPFPSWAVTRAWWCPEKIDDDVSYSSIFENHLDPNTGTAFLLRAWNGKSIERAVQRQFGKMAVVHTESTPDWWLSRGPTSGT